MDVSIPLNEHGQIRVFAINRPPADVKRALTSQSRSALAAEILGHAVADGGTELFPVSDLSGIGLSGYLAEGYTVPTEQLKHARAKLDALGGYVLLVFSSAFEGHQTTLSLGPDVTLIGTFGEALPDMSVSPLESEAALPQTDTQNVATPAPPAAAGRGSLVVVGIMLVLAVILWWVLM